LQPQDIFRFERNECTITKEKGERFPIIRCLDCSEEIGKKIFNSFLAFGKERILYGTYTLKKSDKWVNHALFSEFRRFTMIDFSRKKIPNNQISRQKQIDRNSLLSLDAEKQNTNKVLSISKFSAENNNEHPQSSKDDEVPSLSGLSLGHQILNSQCNFSKSNKKN
jgi:hypothetical protein